MLRILQRLAVVPVVLASTLVLAGCYADAGATTVTSAEVADDYEPAYYDGYVVYYDDIGRPYYYSRGAVVWITASDPHYVGLAHHWHTYGPRYGHWNERYGGRYHEYRRAPGYHSYHGHPNSRGGHHR